MIVNDVNDGQSFASASLLTC